MMSVPPDIDCTGTGLTCRFTQSCCRGERIDPVDSTARKLEKSRPRVGLPAERSHSWMYPGLVPNTVTPCSAAIFQSTSGEWMVPLYRTMDVPWARADSCQFHIIQPVDVWKKSRSS